MIHAYKEFWKRYTDFNGKSTRSEFWYAFLFNSLIGIVTIFIIIIGYLYIFSQVPWELLESGMPEPDPREIMTPRVIIAILIVFIIFLLLLIYGIASIVPSLAISVRRLRDAGFPWGLIFLFFALFLGDFALIVLFCQPTAEKTASNNYPEEL